ncbi:BZ3500_MvSof-1268-A1-R1_Chr3-2g06358 [Microbotryum saponariae]|uniref:BZ3500_MvSof-1268-A1-R1_Chr3-2g06358 protein n=1 Tax=Microbotryum saponariae TaxID=289078 RepID=A0A2X0LHK9_9BASI|nr:BZ3500_MvSof-1268-A1-R1_Chr3-2g06358 [Microbotryum saponariae]SDA04329.1 BZ3501_MvSof-1269-A2-R1_Chr3-2g06049 [Microbotryum saponariae]
MVQSSAKEPTSVGSDQTSTTLAPSPANQSTLPHPNVGRSTSKSGVGKCMTVEEAIEAARKDWQNRMQVMEVEGASDDDGKMDVDDDGKMHVDDDGNDEEHQKGDEDNDDAGDEEGGSGSGGEDDDDGGGDDDSGEDDDGHDSSRQNDRGSEENDHDQGGLASDESRLCAPTFAEVAIYAWGLEYRSECFDATKLPKSFSTLETRVKAHLCMCVIRRHVVPRKASKTTIAKTGSKANRTTTSAYTLGLKEQIELRILGKSALLGSGLGDFAEVRTNLWELRATSGAKAWWQVARPTLWRQQTVSDRDGATRKNNIGCRKRVNRCHDG